MGDLEKTCEPLTPNHLLLQKAVHVLPPGVFVREDKFARRMWRQAQVLADHFWKRWLREYISGLQERQKWQRPRRNAEIGDLVLLVDDCLPRGQWRMVRVSSRKRWVRLESSSENGRVNHISTSYTETLLLEESRNLQRD